MPGARVGVCCCANSYYVEQMIKVQQACSANASIISQEGLHETWNYILSNPKVLKEVVAIHYEQRTSYATKRLNEIAAKHMKTEVARVPEATFYVFASFKSTYGNALRSI
jgi:aspartate/methionine/tyrosine aminotransferase